MVKNFILSLCLIGFVMPAFADRMPNQDALDFVNTNSNFSGTFNTARPKFPSLKKSLSTSDIMQEDAENEMGSGSEAHEIKINPKDVKHPPMNYSNFPQNYDSSNSMMMMQGGMQNLFMQ